MRNGRDRGSDHSDDMVGISITVIPVGLRVWEVIGGLEAPLREVWILARCLGWRLLGLRLLRCGAGSLQCIIGLQK